MREISANTITEAVARLCVEANTHLGEDALSKLESARERETSPLGQQVLGQLLENARLAREESMPLCQDCGTVVVFLELGQDAHVVGGNLRAAIEEGVRRGYRQGYFRGSIVRQPFTARQNTGDNTPPVIHTEIVPGDKLRIVLLPKGGGGENMSRLAMLTPAQGRQRIIETVVKAVEDAGGNPCPPTIVGVGIGGTADKAMLLAKVALLRPVGSPSGDPETAELEAELLERINRLGIGPLGFGGITTALAVHVETYPCHIAALPVAVNLQCHSARVAEAVV
ncbi:MAG: fumarate hydratase [Chloroflexi bacterium]|nr:fumarate hydratase [Chloroflexota bacterium]